MEFVKKRNNVASVEEVIMANTGMPLNLLDGQSRPPIEGLDDLLRELSICRANGSSIKIIDDYDMDGQMSGEILREALEEYLGKPVESWSPRRFSQGYGIKSEMVTDTKAQVILTVDNGIVAVEPVRVAKSLGKKVYIVDHHQRREDGLLPEADVIIDPHVRGGYNGYCAAGLALRIAEHLLPNSTKLPYWEAMAALGTVADVVPLVGDNRRIVKKGLERIRKGEIPTGLKCLIERLGIEYVTEESIGFSIAPCCNAAGRLLDNGADFAKTVLGTDVNELSWTYDKDMAEIRQKVEALVQLNEERKALVSADMKRVRQMIEQNGLAGKKAICLDITNGDPRQSGWVGIIAGKISERYNAVSCVFTADTSDRTVLKGSGRTGDGNDAHLKHLLDQSKDILCDGYGGHQKAAGMRVPAANLAAFDARLNTLLRDVPFSNRNVAYFDLDAELRDIPFYAQELTKGAPYGEGNPVPKFRITFEAIPKEGKYFEYIGNENESIKFRAAGCDVLAFNAREEYEKMGTPDYIECIGSISENVYRGERRIQFVCDYFRPAKKPQKQASSLMSDLLANLAKFQ